MYFSRKKKDLRFQQDFLSSNLWPQGPRIVIGPCMVWKETAQFLQQSHHGTRQPSKGYSRWGVRAYAYRPSSTLTPFPHTLVQGQHLWPRQRIFGRLALVRHVSGRWWWEKKVVRSKEPGRINTRVGPGPKPSDGSSLDWDKEEVPCSRNGDLNVITLIYPKSYSLVVVRQCGV